MELFLPLLVISFVTFLSFRGLCISCLVSIYFVQFCVQFNSSSAMFSLVTSALIIWCVPVYFVWVVPRPLSCYPSQLCVCMCVVVVGWGSPKDYILSSCSANILIFSHSCDWFLVYFLLPESSIWVCNLQTIWPPLLFIAKLFKKTVDKPHKECSFFVSAWKRSGFLALLLPTVFTNALFWRLYFFCYTCSLYSTFVKEKFTL